MNLKDDEEVEKKIYSLSLTYSGNKVEVKDEKKNEQKIELEIFAIELTHKI